MILRLCYRLDGHLENEGNRQTSKLPAIPCGQGRSDKEGRPDNQGASQLYEVGARA